MDGGELTILATKSLAGGIGTAIGAYIAFGSAKLRDQFANKRLIAAIGCGVAVWAMIFVLRILELW